MRIEEWPAASMASWLSSTRRLQVECFGGDPAHLEGEAWVAFIRNMTLGLIVEATEALNEVKAWKWWRSSERFDREAYIEELVDVMHFVGAMAVAVGVTDTEWAEAYAKKSAVVRARAKESK
jgi:hypothetical protein